MKDSFSSQDKRKKKITEQQIQIQRSIPQTFFFYVKVNVKNNLIRNEEENYQKRVTEHEKNKQGNFIFFCNERKMSGNLPRIKLAEIWKIYIMNTGRKSSNHLQKHRGIIQALSVRHSFI